MAVFLKKLFWGGIFFFFFTFLIIALYLVDEKFIFHIPVSVFNSAG